VQGKSFLTLLKNMSRFRRALARMEKRGRDSEVIEALVLQEGLTADSLKSEAQIKKVVGGISAHLKLLNLDNNTSFTHEKDPEHETFSVKCSSRRNGISTDTIIDRDLLNSAEFQELKNLTKTIKESGEPPFTVATGNGEIEILTFRGLVEHVLDIGKKGLTIQRYKGLGEMNPGQLWETTMDPEKRVLLQVRVEDAVEADAIFTKLMGDVVEPRREFIEKHALEVSNLDV